VPTTCQPYNRITKLEKGDLALKKYDRRKGKEKARILCIPRVYVRHTEMSDK
jgi:hypothetical protein